MQPKPPQDLPLAAPRVELSMGITQTIRDCWAYRALVSNLTGRQVTARYRGSVLGFLWTLLNPLLLMAVYSLVFTVYTRIDMDHYSAFVFTGLLPWLWFVSTLGDGALAIVGNGSLITKAMFPPEVLPLVSVLANFINFVFALPVLFLVLAIAGIPPGVSIVALPLLLAVQLLIVLGLVFLLSALNAQYRDVQHLLANVLTFWFFLCPVIYPVSNVPERFRALHSLNFMGELVVAYQDVLYHRRFPDWTSVTIVAVVGAALLLVGEWRFRRVRDSFAEWV